MLSLIVLVGILVALPPQASRVRAADDPPMFAVHDLASGELQKRRTIPAGKFCDADFGAELEGIVTEMEQNKDSSETIAQKLEEQFKGIMERNANKFLCQKSLWCDLGECKKRPSQPARNLRSDDESVEAPRVKKADEDHVSLMAKGDKPKRTTSAKPKPSPTPKKATTSQGATKNETSAATTNTIALSSFIVRFTLLAIIAQVIPRNLGD